MHNCYSTATRWHWSNEPSPRRLVRNSCFSLLTAIQGNQQTTVNGQPGNSAQCRLWLDLVLHPTKMFNQGQGWTEWTIPEKLSVKDAGMSSPSVSGYPTWCNAILDVFLDESKHPVSTIFPNYVTNAEELGFDDTDINRLFMKWY